MAIFSLLNNTIELGEKIIDIKKLEFPTKYRDIPKILSKNKILSKEEYKIFDKMIIHRNNIAHEYDVNITEMELFWCIENLGFVKKFQNKTKKLVFEENIT